ncbi:MAG: hypothetical protein II942_02205 [Alphaproteobacteria bacterium]|nr:hypothetical protein [Alphaproteobacteria bacterium]
MDISLTKNEKITCCRWARQLAYFFVLIGIMLFVWWMTDERGAGAFIEDGIIENIQMLILGLSAASFAWLTYKNKNYRAGLLGLMSLCIFALFREQDAWFDAVLPMFSWKIAFIFPTLALVNGLRNPKSFKKQVFEILTTPAFYMMFGAMVIIIPVAQCLGHKPLMMAVLDMDNDHLARILRRLVEESTELVGYVIILLSSIELSLNLRERLSK